MSNKFKYLLYARKRKCGFFQGKSLENVAHLCITNVDGISSLTIDSITADDCGKYVVRVDNGLGNDYHFASVAVEGTSYLHVFMHFETKTVVVVFFLPLLFSAHFFCHPRRRVYTYRLPLQWYLCENSKKKKITKTTIIISICIVL